MAETSEFLFPDFAPKPVEKPVKEVSYPSQDKASVRSPNMNICGESERERPYTYNDYLRFHCGNSAAAGYWWKKHMQRVEKNH